MRRSRLTTATGLLSVAIVCACGVGTTEPRGDIITLQSPVFQVTSGMDTTLCLYLRMPNTTAIAVKSLKATLPPGIASAALLITATEAQPVGTFTSSPCGAISAGATTATTLFETRSPSATLTFPSDDGTGTPVAGVIAANQPVYLRIRYLNPTTGTLAPRAAFTVSTWPALTTVTRADPYITYNNNISVAPGTPANPTSGTATDSCATPAGAKFFRLTMFTHIYAASYSILDGATVRYNGTDPGVSTATTALASPFITFASNRLTYTCSYLNPVQSTLTAGDSFIRNESCMALGWYFPSTHPTICLNSVIIASAGARSEGHPSLGFSP